MGGFSARPTTKHPLNGDAGTELVSPDEDARCPLNHQKYKLHTAKKAQLLCNSMIFERCKTIFENPKGAGGNKG